MKDIEIKITKSTRFVDIKTEIIGNDGESLQSKLIFTFKDEFVDGQARLEYEINCEKYYAPLEKIGEGYEENNRYYPAFVNAFCALRV